MHRILALATALFFAFSAFAQTRIIGNIADFNSHAAISGATLRCYNSNNDSVPIGTTTTAANGRYSLTIRPGGPYTLRASAIYHTDSLAYQVYVDSLDVVVENFLLRAPIFSLTPDTIRVNMAPGNTTSRDFTLTNPGSDSLNWRVRYRLGFSDEVNETFDTLLTIPVSQRTPETAIRGSSFLNGVFYVTGANNYSNPKKIYKFDSIGTYLGSFDQPSNVDGIGYRTLTNDGVNLYASASAFIDVLNPTDGTVLRRITGPANPNRAAFDPVERVLWVGDAISQIYKIDTTGRILATFPQTGNIRGIAVHPEDPDGYRVYIANARGTVPNDSSWITKMHPQTGAMQMVRMLERHTSAELGGIDFTNRWSRYYWVMIATWLNASTVTVMEQQVSVPWMQVTPLLGVVRATNNTTIHTNFNASLVDTGDYRASILFSGNHSAALTEVPVYLHIGVNDVASPRSSAVPTGFVVSEPQPNPFNPTTRVSVTIPIAATLKVTLIDALGREIRSDQMFAAAGTSNLQVNASQLASGIYFLEVRAIDHPNWRAVKKLLLTK